MTVIAVEKDPDRLVLVLTNEFEAEPERVWQLWANPRLLEKWWGPPGYPATFVEHDLSAGGHAHYFMTGPEGEKYHGLWKVVAAEQPSRIEIRDRFATEDGKPDESLPESGFEVRITAVDGAAERTRMVIDSSFGSVADMEKILEMGAEEGMKQSFGQIDALLAAGTA
jgi:uncharacterized protein YndB with AHSA1/START domain